MRAIREFANTMPNLPDTKLVRKFIDLYGNIYGIATDEYNSIHRLYNNYKRANNSSNIKQVVIEPNIEQVKEQQINISKISILTKKKADEDKILKLLFKKSLSIRELCAEINESEEYVQYILDELRDNKYHILTKGNKFYIEKTPFVQQGVYRIDISRMQDKIIRFGATADNHLNSKYERLDVLHAIYDFYEQEGIDTVYNGGNWIDGEARFNRQEVLNHGLSSQINYFIENYPQRKGLTTYFIAGDDHEGWYWQREGINIGEYMQMKAEMKGRSDLKYLGYLEYDIEYKTKSGAVKVRLMHGGGGSAYAISYSPQKMIESFQGGEKPNVLLLGHYHKADYMFYRNVHCLQLGTTQDQSTFMRKRKIQASLGAWLVEMHVSEDGSVLRFKPEWISFFDKSYYNRKKYYIL